MTSEFGIAVHALVFLNHKAKIVSSEELAKNICTNAVIVRKVMNKLKSGGLIDTKKGVEGGYFIVKDASEITLKDVSKIIETKFVSAYWKSGNVDMECLIASGMANIMDNIYDELDKLCKDRLQSITIKDIDKKIFR